jgi:hypothetical protein
MLRNPEIQVKFLSMISSVNREAKAHEVIFVKLLQEINHRLEEPRDVELLDREPELRPDLEAEPLFEPLKLEERPEENEGCLEEELLVYPFLLDFLLTGRSWYLVLLFLIEGDVRFRELTLLCLSLLNKPLLFSVNNFLLVVRVITRLYLSDLL